MKKILSYLIMFCSLWSLQAKGGFDYQSIIQDDKGKVVINQPISVRFSIIKDSSGSAVTLYSETHQTQTDKNGLLKLIIGEGNSTEGVFDLIDWNGKIELKTEINKGEGFFFSSTQPLANTPYAFSAEKTLTLRSDNGTQWSIQADNQGNLSTHPIPSRFSKLVFHDEFEGLGFPDENKWSFEEGYVRNGEFQYYTVKREENCYLKDGYLHIVCRNDSSIIKNAITWKKWIYPWDMTRKDTMIPITSASIVTKDKFHFTYGRVEMRAKLPVCKGTWSAFWMMPQKEPYGYWPSSGEIDIMEHVGYMPEKVHFTLHSQKWNSGTNPNIYAKSTTITDVTQWHTYAVEWHEDRIFFYVDDELTGRLYKKPEYTWKEWPFHIDFYLIANFAFGGSWGDAQKNSDVSKLPLDYIIDYIRVYQ